MNLDGSFAPITTDAPPPGHKNRRAGLIVFGILLILIGAGCALMIPMMILGQLLTPSTRPVMPVRQLIPAILVYAGLATAFIWLGIGSIQCRRWARALILVFGWIWLVIGLMSAAFLAILLPQVLAAVPTPTGEVPPEVRLFITLFTMGCAGIVYILLPGVLVLFYQSRHVKATCEIRDPVRRWTDACPLPVLAACLLLATGGMAMLAIPLGYRSVLPFFGMLISGIPALLLILAMSALFLWLTWAFYRLQPRGWWVALVYLVVMTASTVITFSRVNLLDMYRTMGFPADQLEMMEQLSFLRDNLLVFFLAAMLPYLGFILWLKRYFKVPPVIPADPAALVSSDASPAQSTPDGTGGTDPQLQDKE
jgi:hypothetical protein